MRHKQYATLWTYRVQLGSEYHAFIDQSTYDRYDTQRIMFTVKKKYIKKWLRSYGEVCSVKKFIESIYTYDDSEQLFYWAVAHGWVKSITIVRS